MKIIMISVALIALFSFGTGNKLAGRWQTQVSSKGNVTSAIFKADSTFEGYINNKAFVTGTYSVDGNDVLSFVDNGCEGKTGTYQLKFFSNGDSVRMEPISDECENRKKGMSVLVFGRIK